jgi:hypothetical protein
VLIIILCVFRNPRQGLTEWPLSPDSSLGIGFTSCLYRVTNTTSK